MADWDDASPADNDIVSQYPANERDARAAVIANFGVDHHETNDADVGKHEVIQVVDNAADPTIGAGEVGVWNNGGVLKSRVGAASPKTLGYQGELNAPTGTKMLFFQASAPTGWTQDTSVNDRVLKVVSGTGGGTGGSWTISGVTVDNHTLTVSEMPSHDHGGSTGSDGGHTHTGSTDNDTHDHNGGAIDTSNDGTTSTENIRVRAGSTTTARFSSSLNGFPSDTHNHSLNINSVSNHNHSISGQGGGNAHNHGLTADGSWRPSHINVIAATKD